MKSLGLLAMYCALSFTAKAQNIVTNWDFSTPCSCPYSLGTSLIGTSEFFQGWRPHMALNSDRNRANGGLHSNSGTNNLSIMGVNYFPFPYVGSGYLALVINSEIKTAPNGVVSQFSLHMNNLQQTLQQDTTYCVEMRVRAWNGYFAGWYSCETHDKLGVYFSDQDSLSTVYPWEDGIVPQVWNFTGYISNTNHWRQVRGSFTANGGEQYMYIGNFDPFSTPSFQHTMRTQMGEECNDWGLGYILIDAVMVYNCRDTVFNITLQDTIVCHGTTVTLEPLVAGFKLEDTVRTYTWHTPMGTFTNADTFFVATQPGTYTLEVMINKRFKATQTITVKWMAPEPEPRLLPEGPLPWCRDQRLPLHVPYIDSAQYRWNNGSTDTLTYYDWPGTYTVELIHPCWQYTESVEVEPRNCHDIWIPNAFTPDGDGTNDFFEIRGLHEENGLPITLIVTDRWGKVVFQSNDYQNTWDGTYNGQPLQAGVYTYRVIYNKVKGGINYEEYGTVQIVR